MYKLFLVLLLLLGAARLTRAQAPGTTGPTPQSPTSVPLDGGASLLLASGAIYGARRLRQHRRA